jgi:hypothetical protein
MGDGESVWERVMTVLDSASRENKSGYVRGDKEHRHLRPLGRVAWRFTHARETPLNAGPPTTRPSPGPSAGCA